MNAVFKVKPAIEGGSPVRNSYLKFHEPSLGKEERDALNSVLQSGWITSGGKTKIFEDKIAEYVNARYAVAVNSCTSAMHLSLSVLGIKKGDQVITTSLSFVSTANVIVHCGADPVFVDVNPDLNIDTGKIGEKIGRKTKAIIPVHLYGQPCCMDEIREIAKAKKIAVVEDAAHALETVYKGKKIGAMSEATCFSFHPGKNITTIEGGMITTNNKHLAEKARCMSRLGLDQSTWGRYMQKKGYRHAKLKYAGYKYHMTDMEAAVGISQLKKINKFWTVRKKYTQMYSEAFKNLPQVRAVSKLSESGSRNAYHLFVIELVEKSLKVKRDYFLNALMAENIGVGVHYTALHLQPFYYKNYGFKKGQYPNAEYASANIISLPLYPKMKKTDVEDVIRAIHKIINFYKR